MFVGEVAAGAGLLLFCWLIGLPVVLGAAALYGSDTSRPHLAGLAPAIGLAVLSVVVVGCYMFLGATKNWATASAIVLGLAAVAGMTALTVTRRSLLATVVPPLLIAFAISLAIFLVWSVPQLLSGPDATFIRSNPSDTMMYVSLSESTRTLGLQQIIDGRGVAEIPATSALLQENAIGLYSARMVGGVLRLGTFNVLGWMSQMTGLGVENLLWVFGAACVACLASATFTVVRLLGGGTWLAIGAGAASTLNYWVATSADADAFSSLHVLPIIMVFVGAMILLHEKLVIRRAADASDIQAKQMAPWLSMTVLGGFLLGAVFISYIEMAPFVGIALAASVVVWTLQQRFSVWPLIAGLATVIVALLVILAAGQLPYLTAILARQVGFAVGASGAIGSYASDETLSQNAISAIAGFPWVDEVVRSMRISRAVGLGIEWFLSILLVVVALAAGLLSLVPKAARLTVPAALVASLIAACIYGFVVKHDTYWVLKTMSIAAPFVVLLVASLGPALVAVGGPRAGVIAGSVAGLACLAAVVAFGAGRLSDDIGRRIPVYTANVHRGQGYDISKITAELDRRCPCKLVVNLPPESDWWRAMYFAKSFQRFSPFPQMGVFFDNKAATLPVTKLNAVTAPQYAVVSQKGDYVGPGGLGDLIVEQSGVRLYAIKAGTPADFEARPIEQ